MPSTLMALVVSNFTWCKLSKLQFFQFQFFHAGCIIQVDLHTNEQNDFDKYSPAVLTMLLEENKLYFPCENRTDLL